MMTLNYTTPRGCSLPMECGDHHLPQRTAWGQCKEMVLGLSCFLPTYKRLHCQQGCVRILGLRNLKHGSQTSCDRTHSTAVHIPLWSTFTPDATAYAFGTRLPGVNPSFYTANLYHKVEWCRKNIVRTKSI